MPIPIKQSSVPSVQAKDVPVNFRAKQSQRDLIDRAAQLLSKTRTDFILDTMTEKATEVLLDQRLFIVDEEQYQTILDILETPLSENEGYQRLMARKPAWER
ncbi:DUF1778 domain-containing protein [Salmonella enterica]|nr:DUF1778 domain-containing protein [Salmonella enterica]EDR1539101.1 DUF1778 domain-containing protein [Salmonella enterica subsp. enterica serovar Javiana]EGO3302113.1 DUF1778 domain-containing protein [Salmonella enterica]EHC5972878.1 DUF1778 domain-containing protein [Salmonella enterica]EIU9581689.1 DUF1778 domain-containing protein [Salmonella enterica]